MWKRFPEVISFDNTYNTNRFKLPLFQATGQTALTSVYNAAFGLIDNERIEGFQFLVESIRQLAEQHSIRQPDVIITDVDSQMKAALNSQFPTVQQQLCIHHINSNVLLKSKQKWTKSSASKRNSSSGSSDSSDVEISAAPARGRSGSPNRESVHQPATEVIPHDYRGVLTMWKLVVFAETEEAHEQAWASLCKEFDDQRAHFAYRNFGIRVTSGTEASNNNVKSYLLNGMSQLYRLVEAMEDMVRDQERDFIDACAADEVLAAREYLGSSSEYLGELRTTLSSKALGLITIQSRLARKAMPTGRNPFPERLGHCSQDCSISTELGIPCCHTVYLKLASGTPFTKWDVHPRWRLREPSSRDPYRRILDPKIATALRGRPKNTAEIVPARLSYIPNDPIGTQRIAQSVQTTSGSRRRRQGRSCKRKKPEHCFRRKPNGQ
ncbi:hypothetical protein HIM_11012 [Hirsutella minnesotensis 3608]|uniref:MULE transposase domain-containing protein n=1 Tax=Hirsutella minnesotensis 3608 TaxID=1043627 RepID=A0A0F7ZRH0_9HYPO|nr:hypothetical protein HIM_11012 [Hirsutella minnesotensis 3608]